MRYQRCLRYSDLPPGEYPKGISYEELVRESDEAFDKLSAALSEKYLVDDEGGYGPKNAVISMYRYMPPCRHHNIVARELAWHPDTIEAMHDLLQQLPDGWTFGIDATKFPPGQASIIVERDGTVFGWSQYRSRGTLTRFGFSDSMSLWWCIRLMIADAYSTLKYRWKFPRRR